MVTVPRLEKFTPTRLKDGDQIQICNDLLVFCNSVVQVEEASDSTAEILGVQNVPEPAGGTLPVLLETAPPQSAGAVRVHPHDAAPLLGIIT